MLVQQLIDPVAIMNRDIPAGSDLEAVVAAQAAQNALLKAEAQVRIDAIANALSHLQEASGLYLYNGASQSDVEQHLWKTRELARDAEHVLEGIETDIARLSKIEEDD